MSELQFEKGQLLAYGTNGICIVDDIKLMSMVTGMKPETYYILKQKKDSDSKIFVPINNAKLTGKMRELMNKSEIDDLLSRMYDDPIPWDSDRRVRNDMFHNIIMEGVSLDLLRVINCIYAHRDDLNKVGKKLPVTDSNTLKTAEKLVVEEFSCVLEVEPGKLNEYVRNLLGKTEGEQFFNRAEA